jgi:hypothetical protein
MLLGSPIPVRTMPFDFSRSLRNGRRNLCSGWLVCCLAIVPAGLAVADATPEIQTAAWTSHDFVFDYRGFTARYSCDGLRDKVRQMLLKLGARKDLKVSIASCGARSDRPDPLPSVRVQMSTLNPAPPGEGAPVAHWEAVNLAAGGDLEGGDCELVEQFVKEILPYFTTRKLEAEKQCVPHQLPTGTLRFRLEALRTTTP